MCTADTELALRNLGPSHERLKTFNAQRKLRLAANTVRSAMRFKFTGSTSDNGSPSDSPAGSYNEESILSMFNSKNNSRVGVVGSREKGKEVTSPIHSIVDASSSNIGGNEKEEKEDSIESSRSV